MLDHEAVADAAVIGVKFDYEERPRAYVVLAQGKNATEKDIQEFMKKHVTRTKWLTGGVRFVQSIPKNPVSFKLPFVFSESILLMVLYQSGKILRKVLRDNAKAEQQQNSAKL